jgi:hypothetical protein
MRALPAPTPASSPSRRLPVLVGLAVLVAIGMALWPEASPSEDVVASSPRPGRAMDKARPAPAPAESAVAPRLVRAAAVDLFAGHSWYRPPPPAPYVEVAPPPPTAPPFPYVYIGQYERPGDKPVYYLQRGDSVFDVQVGQVLDGVWNIDAVADGRMRLTYAPLKLPQVISLGSTP